MVRDISTGQIRYYGRVPCPVIDNIDSEAKGRIRISHPIFGESSWIYYLRTPIYYDVPSIGDLVYVEGEWGNNLYLVAWGNLTKGDINPEVNNAFKRQDPTNRGFCTPGGHLIEFDDGLNTDFDPGVKKIGIRITSSSGKKINISDTDNKITIQSSSGSYITIDDNTNTTVIEGTNIKLGPAATEAVVKGNILETWLNSHVHTSALPGNPTSPPMVLLTGAELSTKVKTE
jgi:hypothetical protein